MADEVPLDELLQTAINGIAEIQAKTRDELRTWLRSQPFLPPMIPLKGGGIRFTTRDGLQALHEFGRRWRQEDRDRRRLIGEEAAAQLPVTIFGEMLSRDAPQDLPADAEIKSWFKERLNRRLAELGRDIEYSFPCQIFDDRNVPSFNVGPAQFLQRDEWLAKVERRAKSVLPWVDAVRTCWTQKSEPPPPREMTASTVIEAFGSCHWVVTIVVSGRERDRARETAEAAARIAVDTLGLPLGARTARRLRAPGDEIDTRHSHLLSQVDGHDLVWSASTEFPSLGLRPGDAVKFVNDCATLRRAAGIALATLIESTPATTAPNMHRRWLEAMYWFGEARRETVGFIALVKTGICLDVLAKGGKSNGILELCCALFDKKPDATVAIGGRTLKWLIGTIYDEGRSQIAHGGRLALMEDLPIDRESADVLARYVLSNYAICLDRYSGADDYDEFLKSIPTIRV